MLSTLSPEKRVSTALYTICTDQSRAICRTGMRLSQPARQPAIKPLPLYCPPADPSGVVNLLPKCKLYLGVFCSPLIPYKLKIKIKNSDERALSVSFRV